MHEAQAGRDQAAGGLRAYLGMRFDVPVQPAEHNLAPIATRLGDLNHLVARALDQRPELRALREGQEAHMRLAAAEAAGAFPDVLAYGFVSAAYTPGRQWVQTRYVFDPLGHFVPGLVIGLRWSFTGDMPHQRADEQRAEADRLASLRRFAVSGIPAEVRRAYDDVVRARADLTSAASAVRTSKRWAVRTSADFGVGLGDSRSVADSLQAYVGARTAQLEAIYHLNVGLAELSRAMGTLSSGSGLYLGGRSHGSVASR